MLVTVSAGWKKLFWDALLELCPTQSLPVHITHFLWNRQKDPSKYEIGKKFIYQKDLKGGNGGVYTLGVDMLLSVNIERAGVTTEKSLIRYEHAGLCIFVASRFGQVMEFGYLYRSPVSANLFCWQKPRWDMGKDIQGSSESFQICAYQLDENLRIGITLDLMCGLCQPRYVKCDTSTMLSTLLETMLQSWSRWGMYAKVMWTSTRQVSQIDQLSFSSKVSGDPNFTKHKCFRRIVL